MDDPLAPFWNARGIALVGASAQPVKLSYGVLQNLVRSGYPGRIYPVNPRGGEILGLPVYRSLAEVPDPVDLAILMVPAEQSVAALEACGRRGIRAAILVASGFAERGGKGGSGRRPCGPSRVAMACGSSGRTPSASSTRGSL